MPEMQRAFNYSLRALLLGILLITSTRSFSVQTPSLAPPSPTPQVLLVPLGSGVSLRQQSWILWLLARQGWKRWRWLPPQKLPNTAYSKRFKRYRAERISRLLRQRHKEKSLWIIGITNEDISTELKGFLDHAVLGLADLEHATMLLSTARLPQKASGLAWRSLLLHEWGHLLGLGHCPKTNCVMFDRLGHPPSLPWSEHFCRSCAQRIQKVKQSPPTRQKRRVSP